MSTTRRFATHAALLAGAIALAGCATGGRLERVMREDASGYVVVGGEEASSLVTVFRDGGPLAARPPLTLQPGDELETGAGGAALVQLPDGGLVVIDARSRVRIGSLEVLFGRVFAAVRGLFSVESENVVAGVEGTEFAFEVAPDRGVRVVVLEGVVVCTSKAGRWPPTRLRSGLGFATRPGGQELPRVGPASPRELDDIRAWVRRVSSATRPGYCCADGRVFASQSNACRGAFYADRASAQRACAPPPEPAGWCCDEGRVSSSTRAQCRGAFYTDSASARKACVPEPVGWCCDAGRVTSGTRRQCGGTFYTDRASAKRACARAKVGWCCLPNYQLEQLTSAACTSRKGKFYTDQRTARAACKEVEVE
jgi:hypothetical protein